MPDNTRKSSGPKFRGRPRPERGRRQEQPKAPDPNSSETLIWGMHPVEAALANPARIIGKLWLTENAARRVGAVLAERGITHESVSPKDLDRRLGADTVHQGALLETEPLADCDLLDLVAGAETKGPLIVLDQVTDPHNVGAILRSAAVFGSSGLVMTQRHSPPLGGALAKAASGALELMPVALVANLSRALAALAEEGVVTIGLDGDAPELLEDVMLDGSGRQRALAIVLGAEGKGLRQLTRETCQHVCSIATTGPIASLNVSNAAAIALHLAAMDRRRRAAR